MAEQGLQLVLEAGQSLPVHVCWRLDDGYLRAASWTDQAEIFTLGIWGPGEIVVPQLLTQQPMELRALSAVRVQEWNAGTAEHEDFTTTHIQQLGTLLRLTRIRPAEARLFHLLIWLSRRFGVSTEQGRSVPLESMNLTHRLLAEMASVYLSKKTGNASEKVEIWPIIQESLQSSAVTALLLGVALGILTRPEPVYESFFNPLFRGFLAVLMIIMGMEAAQRMNELRKVAQWFAIYAFIAPILHGFLAFGLGLIIHKLTGFSIGGCVVLAVIAASSSDISGPPTLRAGIPSANPSSYIGASTAIGTPVAIAICIPLFIGLAEMMLGR